MCTIFLSLMTSVLLLGFILVHFNTENVETRTNYKTAGVDSVTPQESTDYDNTIVSRRQVTTAIDMFMGRDVAIVIQTEAFRQLGSDLAINYGAILTSDGKSSTSGNLPGMYAKTNIGAIIGNLDTFKNGFITKQAKTAYVVSYVDGTNEEEASIWRESREGYYFGYLHTTDGLVDSRYDTIGTTELGNAAYILSSGRFLSVLIKDPTGYTIGILFKQLQG